METLKINIPEGYEIDTFDAAAGEIKFKEKPKNIMERIKTIDDILEYHGLTLSGVDRLFNHIPDHLKFQYITELLYQTLNEGWEPDWNDPNQYKYFPWFEMAGSSGVRFNGCDRWTADSTVGSRLCFKSRDLAEYAGKQFTELFESFMI